MPRAHRLGADAEDRAADYLLGIGWTLVARRVKVTGGELDLVAWHGDTLVLVEVKARSGGAQDALEAITPQKRRRLRAAGESYVARCGLSGITWRFDLIAIQSERLEHVQGLDLDP